MDAPSLKKKSKLLPHDSHLHMVRSLDPLVADVIRTTPTSLILQLIIVILIVKKLKKISYQAITSLVILYCLM